MRSDNAALQVSTLYGVSVDTPASILGAKRVLELDSDVGVTLAISPKISSWVDQGPLGNTPSQSSSAKQPTRVLSVLDGHAAIRSDGSDDSLRVAGTYAGLVAGDRPYVYCVYTPRAGSSPYTQNVWALDTNGLASATNNLQMLEHVTTTLKGYNGVSQVAVAESALVARLVTLRWAASTLELDLNNTNIGSVASGGFTTTPLYLTLADRVAAVSLPGANDYFRMVISNPAPTAEQHARMIAYFKAQYPSLGL